MIYYFTSGEPTNNFNEYPIYALYKKIKKGAKWSELTDNEKYSFNEIGSTGYLYKDGYYEVMGWKYDFKPYMKRFLVNLKYYGWVEFYALSKMQIRETTYSKSHILEIIEAPKK